MPDSPAAIVTVKTKNMMNKLLDTHLEKMKHSLQQRSQWPIDDEIGIDPHEENIWRKFMNSPHAWVPVLTDGLPPLSDDPDDELRELLCAPEEVRFYWGNARPHILWVQNLSGRNGGNMVPHPANCTAVDYLELEELIHGFAALEAMLLEQN